MPKDFRSYLDELLEKRPKDVVVVDKEVDPLYEASAIVEKFERENEFPLVFFKNIKGSKIPLVDQSRRHLRAAGIVLGFALRAADGQGSGASRA